MSSNPGDPTGPGSGNDPDDPSGGSGQGRDPNNPFQGTPFEQLFSQLGGGGGMPDLSALMGQVQSLMQPHEGPINWEFVVDQARRQATQETDPTPTGSEHQQVADAVRLADHWLDETTSFPSGVRTTEAWSRSEWITRTQPVWEGLVNPMASQATQAIGDALPEQAQQMGGPLMDILGKVTGMMVAGQVASGLGALAGEVLTSTDVGLPLAPEGTAALLPANVRAYATGLDVSVDDVRLFLALREAAHQRLFAHVPWLRDHLLGAVADYARGIEINTSEIEEQLRGLDPTNPQAMQEALEGGLFEPQQSEQQQRALERLEVTLALIEGWVDDVVDRAASPRMPDAEKLREAVSRRRAAGGPAEQTFGSLVGLELRPRRLRDAATLWGSLRTRQGIEARDGVWMHATLLPGSADLDDPLTFREDATAPESMSEEEFDAGLAQLLRTEQPDDDPDRDADSGDADSGDAGSGHDDEGPGPGPSPAS